MFDDLILPPPLPAIIAVLILLGWVHLGLRLTRRITPNPDALDRAVGFLGGVTATLLLLEGAALAGLAGVVLLRCLGIALGWLGIVVAPRLLRGISAWARRLREWTRPPPRALGEPFAAATTALIVLGLTIAALGPVTDADSIGYHMAVPLEWLRKGVTPLTDLLDARLVGLGENVNLLGIACGTDALGAVLQAASLLLILTTLIELSKGGIRGLVVVTTVASIPVWGFLAPNQKPQLLPIAANVVAFALIYSASLGGETRRLKFIGLPLALAVACKTSFLLTSGPLLIFALVVSARRQCFRPTLGWTGVLFAVVLGPVWIRRFVLYGDPVSPFLEPLRGAAADPVVMRFAALLHDYGRASGDVGVPEWFASLFIPRSLGEWSTTLGPVTALLLIFVLLSLWRSRGVIVVAMAAAASVVFLGQPTARFLVEPVLWLMVAFVLKEDDLRPGLFSSIWLWLASGQAAVAAVAAWLVAWPAIGGAATIPGRRTLMLRSTAGYEESAWINANVPPLGMILSRSRYQLFLRPPHLFGQRIGFLPVEEQVKELRRIAGENGGALWLVADPTEVALLARRGLRFTVVSARAIPMATRNPVNRTGSYELVIVRIGE